MRALGRRLVVAGTLLLAAAALADPPAEKMKPGELCRLLGNMAESVMKARQNGARYADMRDVADNAAVPALKVVAREMVKRAFEYPRFGDEEYKAEARADFRNEIERDCYRVVEEED